jgi:hypothetical protein
MLLFFVSDKIEHHTGTFFGFKETAVKNNVTHKENNILQWWGYSAIYKQQKHCKFMLS